ncbi:hypothetical protein [Microbispora sp. ATCC PTA-5024]|uniref:hypothetical protein n=1 Tax=Microbispora sp. ATCC PTA-5024 TaxID=316330 RepID=UPI0004054722|nr:hypothetical protein [Microbispora sp. ATCC PTA-5024]
MTTGEPSRTAGRRERWARRENERRGRMYEAALSAWRRDEGELRQMLETARSFRGLPPGAVPPSTRLHRGETVLWTAPGARMFEIRHQPPLPPPTLASLSLHVVRGPAGQAPPAQANVTDMGAVTVTSQRVIFHGGRHEREWAFAKMAGLAHDPGGPSTLMRVTNRKYVSGLWLPPAAVAGFRFALALGLADAAGDRAGLAAHLEGLLAHHRRIHPPPPAFVTPSQAPHTARAVLGAVRTVYFGPPGASPGRRAVQGLVTVVATLALIGYALPDAPVRTTSTGGLSTIAQPTLPPAATDGSTPDAAEPTVTVTVRVTTTPAREQPTASPRSTARPRTENTAPPRPRHTRAAVPTAKAVPLCGAPRNPYGYNFCGGALITAPEPDVCSYFSCIPYFSEGRGYMMQCNDGTFSMSGGRQGSCSHHHGNRRPVFA